jgi:hypothetical protein
MLEDKKDKTLYFVEGKDVVKLVGKNVVVKGTISDTVDGKTITITTVEVVK